MKKLSFAHIINPFTTSPAHSLHFAMQVTTLSMERARDFSQKQVDVEFFSAQFPEDLSAVPAGFSATPNLTRSLRDVHQNTTSPKLPFLVDILNALYAASSAEYLIYSNLDIALMPNFYETIQAIAHTGHDAFVINRRTISNKYRSTAELPLMYAEPGELHRGWDCFIFRRELLPRLKLDLVCIGAPLVGLILYANLAVHAQNFREFTDLHLTFHLGDDRAWSQPIHAPALIHNRQIAKQVIELLHSKYPHKFNSFTPLKKYHFWHNNPILTIIYDNLLMNIFLPAKYTRWSKP